MSYDPYAYGQVQLGRQPAEPAASPDDLLFAAPSASPSAASTTADSSWELLQTDVASLLPPSGGPDAAEFGSEILGEKDAMPAVAPRPKAGPARPAPATARRSVGASPASAAASPGGPPLAGAAAAAGAMSGAKVTQPVRSAAPKLAPRPAAGLLATLLPGILLAAGGTVAAWLGFAEQNLVLGGIVGGLAVVGAAFAFVWARR